MLPLLRFLGSGAFGCFVSIMWAVVEVAGSQFRVEEGRYLYAPLLRHAPDEEVSFDKVLLLYDGVADVIVGDPLVANASVKARVIEHLKGDKVVVFKKKRRKGYKIRRGHRQSFTKVMIDKVDYAA